MVTEAELVSQIQQLLNQLADVAIKNREALTGVNLQDLRAKAAKYDQLKALVG